MLATHSPFTIFKNSENEKALLTELCLEWGFWSGDQTLAALNSDAGYQLMYLDAYMKVAALIKVEAFSSELIYIYVHPSMRQRNFATTMLLAVVDYLRTLKAQEKLFCEVRPSNMSARRLYEKIGFISLGIRKSYYSDGEDALTMAFAL